MKNFNYFITATLLLLSTNVQLSYAQNLETQMQNFFSYNGNQAYWWLSKFAHPTNEFSRGYCEMSGSNVYVTIISRNYKARFKIHKNNSVFDSIETLEDNDWWPAFDGSNNIKNILIEFWRNYSSETINRVERIFGNLNGLDSKNMCLAVLSALLWKYPTNHYDSNYNDIEYKNLRLYGSIDNKYSIVMSITIKGRSVSGSYYYRSQGPNKRLALSGVIEDGLMLLYETDEFGDNTGRFLGTLSGEVYQGLFTTRGKKMPYRLTK